MQAGQDCHSWNPGVARRESVRQKTLYLPSSRSKSSDDDEDEEEDDSLRQEMLKEFGLEEDDMDEVRPMVGLLEDIHE